MLHISLMARLLMVATVSSSRFQFLVLVVGVLKSTLAAVLFASMEVIMAEDDNYIASFSNIHSG